MDCPDALDLAWAAGGQGRCFVDTMTSSAQRDDLFVSCGVRRPTGIFSWSSRLYRPTDRDTSILPARGHMFHPSATNRRPSGRTVSSAFRTPENNGYLCPTPRKGLIGNGPPCWCKNRRISEVFARRFWQSFLHCYSRPGRFLGRTPSRVQKVDFSHSPSRGWSIRPFRGVGHKQPITG